MGTLQRNPTEEMNVAYAPSEKHNCSVPLHIDARDFFYASHRFGDFQKTTVPNIAEFKAYGPHKPMGILAMCAASCTHSRCKAMHLLGASDINDGKHVQVQVNGKNVTGVTQFDDCFLLKGESGEYIWEPKLGRFEVGIHVKHMRMYFRVSSFILW